MNSQLIRDPLQFLSVNVVHESAHCIQRARKEKVEILPGETAKQNRAWPLAGVNPGPSQTHQPVRAA
jgi:hypothetical protein